MLMRRNQPLLDCPVECIMRHRVDAANGQIAECRLFYFWKDRDIFQPVLRSTEIPILCFLRRSI